MNKEEREGGSDGEEATETTPALNNKQMDQGDERQVLNSDNVTKNDVKAPLTDEQTKVTFKPADASSPYNGDATVSISSAKGFAGMDKKELMKYCDDPFWVALRWILFITFWLIWVAMLVGAILVVIYAPKCPPPPERHWWQKSPVYEIYARSFKDSNGDGTGDLKGIESKLDYLKKDLGVETVWITPIYKSPMVDNGYDVEDYRDIDPLFGTLEDFESLVEAMKDKGMKLLMDFVPNHTSNKHEWFIKSEKKEAGYEDYYVWKDSPPNKPPNNWLSVFGGSAWEYSKIRNEWYLHQFYKEQPDLNVRNEKVVEELKDILRFWLNKGVHGFRMDAVAHLYEDTQFRDEEPSGNTDDETDYDYLNHTYTVDQPETYALLREFREVLDAFNSTDDETTRVMFTEAYDPIPEIMRYYGNETEPIAQFPFNFELVTMDPEELSGIKMNESVNNWINNMPPKVGWANWVLGNHDRPRVASRFGDDLVDTLNIITMLLPGTPVTYYGEEIGMNDTEISDDQKKDAFGRDPERTPMQWNGEQYAGFSNATPWLPVNPNYKTVNVEAQMKVHGSHLSIYKELVKMRTEKAPLFGDMKTLVVSESIFSFSRIIKGSPGLCVIANFGDSTEEVDLSDEEGVPEDVTLRLPSETKGRQVKLESSSIKVEPNKAVVLTFVPKFN